MSNKMLEAALEYAARGWFVLPLEPGEKFAGYDLLDKLNFDWLAEMKPGEAMIRRWFEIEPALNIGIRLKGSGLTVVDVDDMDRWLNWKKDSSWPNAPCVKTGRGQHFFFVATVGDPCGVINNDLGNVGDCLTPYPPEWKPYKRPYVVAPPSKHPDGAAYEWIVTPDDGEWVTLPEWVRQAVVKPTDPSSWWVGDDYEEDRYCCLYCGEEYCSGSCIYDYEDDEYDPDPEPDPEDDVS